MAYVVTATGQVYGEDAGSLGSISLISGGASPWGPIESAQKKLDALWKNLQVAVMSSADKKAMQKLVYDAGKDLKEAKKRLEMAARRTKRRR